MGSIEGKSGGNTNGPGVPPEVERGLVRTFRFLTNEFRGYYKAQKVPSPPRLSRREFAFTFFGKNFMMRHTAFRQREDLSRFLGLRVPSSAYYSTAYYRTPDAGTMGEKDWLGADLIFDLDADHIPGAENLSFEDMLAGVKKEFEKLIYDYLIGDFGFREKDIEVVFSGGRGYHIHITRQDVLALTSHQRREIVDYITGKGLDMEKFLTKKAIGVKNAGSRFSKVNYIHNLHPTTEGGWKGKFTRGTLEWIVGARMNPEQALKELTSIKGVGKKKAEAIMLQLKESDIGKMNVDAMADGQAFVDPGQWIRDHPDFTLESNRELLRSGQATMDIFPTDDIRKAFMKFIIEKVAINLGGETDEPVTADIKRLIRLPGSLHGKTGFRVIPMSLKELEDFEPLTDSIVLSDKMVDFEVKQGISGRVGEERFSFPAGEKVEVPAYLAAFIAGRKAGFII